MADSLKKKAYESPYSQQIQQLLDEVTRRPDFSYDMNADPLYQQYKDQYTRQGKQAMKNTVGNAAGLTGGYASSAATTAGSQAYQSYLDQLNDRIPELYAAAYEKYQNEGNQKYNQLSLLQSLDESLYGRYRDDIADNQWQASFDYQKDRDAVSDNQWQTSFDYQKTRDQVSDNQWQTAFDYQKTRDDVADDQWATSFDYQKTRDQVADDQWQKEYDYKTTPATASAALSVTDASKVIEQAMGYYDKNGTTGLEQYLQMQLASGSLTDDQAIGIYEAVMGSSSASKSASSTSVSGTSGSSGGTKDEEYSSWPNGITSESDFWKAQRANWPSVRPYATYAEYVKATKK